MSFAKFCSLLDRESHFFSLVGDMEDRYERFSYSPTLREEGDRQGQAEREASEVLRQLARSSLINI